MGLSKEAKRVLKWYNDTTVGREYRDKIIEYGKTKTANGVAFDSVSDEIVDYALAFDADTRTDVDRKLRRNTTREVVRYWYDGHGTWKSKQENMVDHPAICKECGGIQEYDLSGDVWVCQTCGHETMDMGDHPDRDMPL